MGGAEDHKEQREREEIRDRGAGKGVSPPCISAARRIKLPPLHTATRGGPPLSATEGCAKTAFRAKISSRGETFSLFELFGSEPESGVPAPGSADLFLLLSRRRQVNRGGDPGREVTPACAARLFLREPSWVTGRGSSRPAMERVGGEIQDRCFY